MRRLLAWLAGLLSLAALWRYLSRRREAAPVAPAAPAEDDPAEELRRRLDASRAEPAAGPGGAGEPEPVEAPLSLEERRARVHARAQEAIDAMSEPEPPVGA